MTQDYRFRPDMAGRAASVFDVARGQSVPVQRDRSFEVYSVEKRAEDLRQRQAQHHDKHRGHFVDAEYKKLQKQHPLKPGFSRSAGPRPPGGHQNQRASHQQALRQLAEANVDFRHQRRLYTISAIERLQKRKLEHGQTRAQSHQRKRKQ